MFAAAALLVGLVPARGRPACELPVLETAESASGAPVVVCDNSQVAAAFARMGLPRPPAFDGTDPVPVREVWERVRAWCTAGDPGLIGELGLVFLASSQNDSALSYLAAARALDRGDGSTSAFASAWWTYFLGVACQRLEHRRLACELFEDFLGEVPEYPTTLARLGLLHLELEEYDRALVCYEQYRAAQPGQAAGALGIGRVRLALGDAEEAVRVLEEAVRLAPRDFLVQRFLGQALVAAGRDEEGQRAAAVAASLPDYAGLLHIDPELERAYSLARTQHHLEGQLRRAFARGELEVAHAVVDELLERRPRDPDLLQNKASIFMKAGRPREALQPLDAALELDPERFDLHLARARAHFLLGDVAAAQREAEILFELEPENPAAFDLRARCLFQLGERGSAVEAMRAAVERDPDNVDFRFVLATMALQAGFVDEARTAAQSVLEASPGHPGARALIQGLDG